MATAISVFNAQLDIELSGLADADFASADRNAQIKSAVEQYSRDRPRIVTADITGDAGRYYLLSGLTGWDNDFSAIQSIEWEASAVSADELPEYLEDEAWSIYDDGTYKYLLFASTLLTGEKARVTFSAPYAWTAVDDPVTTVPSIDFYAICKLAAALCCYARAAGLARLGSSGIGADLVDYNAKVGLYTSAGKTLEGQYKRAIGLEPGTATATGITANWDPRDIMDTRDFTFHPYRAR